MAIQTEEVNRFLGTLNHPLKEEIEEVRATILNSNQNVTEHIKWKSPSFCYKVEDRVTMRLHSEDRFKLVFHRGAKVKDSKDFVFTDSTGLLEWVADDRATVTFQEMKDVKAKKESLMTLVYQWMIATS